MTGVKEIIINCLPEVRKILPDFLGTKKKKFSIMVNDASGNLSCYRPTSKNASIWHSYGDMAPQK